MSPTHTVTVRHLPDWVPVHKLLGNGPWSRTEDGAWTATVPRETAADLAARTRKLGFGGQALDVWIKPRLSRPVVRAGRTRDARARRDTTPGFTRPHVRLDEEGRWSLTPEALALAVATAARAEHVVDLGCGVGGNSIGFARAGARVTAVEASPQRAAMAQHNASVYEVSDRVRVHTGDLFDHLDPSADLWFVDPPWGTDYDRTCVPLSALPLLARLVPAAQEAGVRLLAKVPPSFDTSTTPTATPRPWFGTASGDRHRVKFLTLAFPA